MTDLQLLLSIGIPSLLIVLGFLNNNLRFERIEKRLDAHDARFDKLDEKFTRQISELDEKFTRQISELDGTFTRQLDDVKTANHKDALEIMRSMTSLHERVAIVESRQAS